MGKTVLVTGGAKGIGKAICEGFAREGYTLYLHYNSSKREAKILKEQLENNYKIKVHLQQADFANPEEVNNLIEYIKENNVQIDTLIHNAGVSHTGLLFDISGEDIQTLFQVNVLSVIALTKEISKQMVKRKNGAIVNISSVWGVVGASCEVVYSATKAALIGFSKALAKELSLSGVRVNAIAPGAIETDMLKEYTKEELKVLAGEIPMGRLGKAEEVANLALFLASDAAGYITGQVLSPDGGMVL